MNCGCNVRYTIKVTQGNPWDLLLTLKTSTFESSEPIDEDIDVTELHDIVITIDNEQWTDYSLEDDGILIPIPGDMALGPHDVILTATYYGTEIRAAYFECFTDVPWSYQSNVGNYIPESPIASEAAYIYVGKISDDELDRLKSEWRLKIAAAEAAKAAAEAAKEAFDAKAESLDNLDNVALQGTDATATNTALKQLLVVIQNLIGRATDDQTAATLFGKIAAVLYAVGNIDFSAIAKESTLNTVKALIGEATDAATAATLFGKLAAVLNAVGNIDFSTLAKQGSNANATLTAAQAAVEAIRLLVGSPASGQPSTLFQAIAAGGESVPIIEVSQAEIDAMIARIIADDDI